MLWIWKGLILFTFLYWVWMAIETGRGLRKISSLRHKAPRVESPSQALLPLVSVIVAAKEEEGSITETVKHLLHQRYPHMELIVINDRSQDATGVKLDELKRWSQGKKDIHIPLRVVHITSLPKGWLGKNHALYQGYKLARGEYLLFTDADVLFHPDTITGAIQYAQKHQVDHVTMAPSLTAEGFWLNGFIHFFLYNFNLYVRPWKVNDDRQTRVGMGIGAFNLLTRKAYEAIGTHQAIAERPDDDLKLGQRVKEKGLRQRFLLAVDHLKVAWYSSIPEAVRGLEKNLFAGLNYSMGMALLAVFGMTMTYVVPFVMVLLLAGWLSWVSLGSVIIMLSLYALQIQRFSRVFDPRELLAFPVLASLFVYVFVRSVYLTYRRGGIVWRGTFYSLRELKRKARS